MIRLFITVDEPDVVIAANYTVIRVYTDTSETGDFTTLDGTVALVAATESYEYTDLDGTASTWYRTCYYGVTPGEGTKSAARKGSTSAAYATVKELRAQTSLSSTTDDVELAQLLDSAALAINRLCNRPDGFFADQTASARYYAGRGYPYQVIDECVAISSVSVKDSASDTGYTAWSAPTSDFSGDGDWIPFAGSPQQPEFNRTPFNGLMVDPNGDYSTFTSGEYYGRKGFRRPHKVARNVPTVCVTARWGYADEIPDTIKMANLMQAARWYKQLQSGKADTLASAELGILLYTKKLDPDIETLLVGGRYIRPATGGKW